MLDLKSPPHLDFTDAVEKGLRTAPLRVSTLDQTTANQERELREIASRMGCEIVKVYKDHSRRAPCFRRALPRRHKAAVRSCDGVVD